MRWMRQRPNEHATAHSHSYPVPLVGDNRRLLVYRSTRRRAGPAGDSGVQSAGLIGADDSLDIDGSTILFDFRWAAHLHRYFDARQLDDKRAMADQVEAWRKDEDYYSMTDWSDRTQLLQLISQDPDAIARVSNLLLESSKPVSWSLLLALEQIDSRLNRPSKELRAKLERNSSVAVRL